MTTTRGLPHHGIRSPRWRPGLAASGLVGLIAVGLAIGVAELLSALGQWVSLLQTNSSPIEALGNAFIQLTPEWLKEFAIRSFGENDKTALKVGMAVILVIVAAAVGVLARRSPRAAVGTTVGLIIVTLVAIWTRTGVGPVDGLPILIGAGAGVYVLVTAFRRTVIEVPPGGPPGQAGPASRPGSSAEVASRASSPVEPADLTQLTEDDGAPTSGPRHPMMASAERAARTSPQWTSDRRQFFRFAALAAAAAAVAGAVSRWIPSTAQVQASRAAVGVPVPLSTQAVPKTVDLPVNGITPFLTRNQDFYRIDTALTPPRLTAADWGLKIHGMVDQEISLNYDQLTARPQQQRMVTLTCVSNPVGGEYIGNASWIGARIDTLLKEAGPNSEADCVLCTSIDGFTSSTPLEALTDGRDAMLAVAMNGEPLPIEHGFPVRMVVPGLYGYVSATKWVVDWEVTQFSKVSAYWTSRGWSDHGPIKTASRIDVPRGTAQYDIGHVVTFAGMAWAQHRGIDSVEVQIDTGAWQQAVLGEAFSKDTWRQWKFVWTATPGTHTIKCRAIDGAGAVQIEAAQDVAPDGATGYDYRTFSVG